MSWGILLGKVLFWAFCFSTFEANAIESGTIIPLYSYPLSDRTWQPLIDAHTAHPINTWAIVNVNSGPGSGSIDSNYKTAIQKIRSVGIKTLGYVRTDYARRTQDEVKAEIDLWKSWYGPEGIFFDEMTNDDNAEKIRYYEDLNNYAKSKGFWFTVGNPGTAPNGKYFNSVDNIVVYEKDIGFPSQNLICSQDTNGKGRDHVSIMPYAIPNLDTGAVRQMKDCAGFIYVSDDGGNNPWDTLPHYLTQLFEILKN